MVAGMDPIEKATAEGYRHVEKAWRDEADQTVDVVFWTKDPYPEGISYDEVDQEDLHRDDGPAVEISDGRYTWIRNGRVHRADGPAALALPAVGGQGTEENWCIHGLQHRLDGPALILYDKSGNPIRESYFVDGDCYWARHRELSIKSSNTSWEAVRGSQEAWEQAKRERGYA